MGSLVTSFGKSKEGIEKNTSAFSSFKTAAGGITIGITSAIAVFTAWYEWEMRGYKATKAQGDALREEAQARKETTQSIQDKMNASLSELNHAQKLNEELKTFVDENGKVKQGYETRANFILNELNKALDSEYKMNGDIITQYKQMQDEIEKTIDKKRVEAIMNSKLENYETAIKNQEQDQKKLNETMQKRNEKLEELRQKLIEIGISSEDVQKIFAGEKAVPYLGMHTFAVNGLWEEYKELCSQVTTVTDTVKDNSIAIADYEYAQQKYTEGGVEAVLKISEDTLKATRNINSIIGQENENMIRNQQDIVKNYKDLLLQDLQNGIDIANSKFAYQVQKEEEALKRCAESLVQQTSTINENSDDVKEAWRALANNSYETYAEIVSGMTPEMQKTVQGITDVIVVGTPGAEEVTKQMSNKILDKMKNYEGARKNAVETLQGYLQGLKDEELRELLKQAGVNDVEEVMKGIRKGNLAEQEGIGIINSLMNGLNNKKWQGNLFGVASGIANKLTSMFSIKASVNTDKKTSLPGFKTGLDYVPYDNFVVRLHEGERILTKEENQEYMNGNIRNNYETRSITVNFYPKTMSNEELEKAERYISRKWGIKF